MFFLPAQPVLYAAIPSFLIFLLAEQVKESLFLRWQEDLLFNKSKMVHFCETFIKLTLFQIIISIFDILQSELKFHHQGASDPKNSLKCKFEACRGRIFKSLLIQSCSEGSHLGDRTPSERLQEQPFSLQKLLNILREKTAFWTNFNFWIQEALQQLKR